MTAGTCPIRPAGGATARRPVRVDGPLLVFGGPYGNLEATQALLAAAAARGVPAANIVCTGDLVAYCAGPQAVIELVRTAGLRAIAGNCEEALAAGADDCGCGFPADSACAGLSGQWYPFVDRHVDADSRRWMASLPHRLDLEMGGHRIAVVHGGVAETSRFVFSSDTAAIADQLAAADADAVVAGHCGLPFTRMLDGGVWHNAGVVGMPANDGTPRVWFSVVESAAGGLAFEHVALDYDHAAAAAKLRRDGLPEGYAGCLETGLWPSVDVLPPEERSRRGLPLAPGRSTWRPFSAARPDRAGQRTGAGVASGTP